MKKFLFYLLLIFVTNSSFSQQGPPWYFINTGVENQHIVLVLPTVAITIDALQVDSGDYIGAFYKLNDTLLCGTGTGVTGDIGGMMYTGDVNAATIWGAEPNVTNGFQDGEVLRWKIWRASDGSVFDAIAEYYPAGSLPSINADSLYHANYQSALMSLTSFTIPGIDMSVNSQSLPLSGCGLDTNEVITVLIENHDTADVFGFYINYSLNSGDTISEFIGDTVFAGSTMEYTFSQTADLSITGTYDFNVWLKISGDVNYTNDFNTLTVENLESPLVSLGPDTAICTGDTIILYPVEYYESYLWNNGYTSYHNYGIEEGMYSITVTNELGCSSADSVYLTNNANPVLNMGDSIAFCEGGEVSYLLQQDFEEIEWSNGASGNNFTVDVAGTYLVTVTDENGCLATDYINVSELPLPVVDLGQNITTSQLDTVMLSATEGFDQYSWSTGEMTSSIYPDTFGIFTVKVWRGECFSSDYINIIYDDTDTISDLQDVYIWPNPTSDYLNILHHKTESGSIKVYNAIGQIVRSYKYTSEKEVVIDVSNLKHGVYIIFVETGKKSFTKRIVKA